MKKLFLFFVALVMCCVAQAQVDGALQGTCSGAAMTLNPAYAANECVPTQAITSITIANGIGANRPFLLIIRNSGGYAFSGWPSNVIASAVYTGTNYLRGTWDPITSQWTFISIPMTTSMLMGDGNGNLIPATAGTPTTGGQYVAASDTDVVRQSATATQTLTNPLGVPCGTASVAGLQRAGAANQGLNMCSGSTSFTLGGTIYASITSTIFNIPLLNLTAKQLIAARAENAITSTTTAIDPTYQTNTVTLASGGSYSFTIASASDSSPHCLVFVQPASGSASTVTAPSNVLGFMTVSSGLGTRSMQCFAYSSSLAKYVPISLGVTGL